MHKHTQEYPRTKNTQVQIGYQQLFPCYTRPRGMTQLHKHPKTTCTTALISLSHYPDQFNLSSYSLGQLNRISERIGGRVHSPFPLSLDAGPAGRDNTALQHSLNAFPHADTNSVFFLPPPDTDASPPNVCVTPPPCCTTTANYLVFMTKYLVLQVRPPEASARLCVLPRFLPFLSSSEGNRKPG